MSPGALRVRGSRRHRRADRADGPLQAPRRDASVSSRRAIHRTGLDIGVHRSDRRFRVGNLSRQRSPQAV